MLLLSLARIFRFAFQSFIRNIWLSVVTITIIVLTILSLTILVLVNVVTDQAIGSIKQKIDISLYFEAGTNQTQVALIEEQVKSINHIAEIRTVSADEALEKFLQTHSGDELIKSAVTEIGENPLGPVIVIKADNIDNYPKILEKIDEFKINELTKEIDYDDHKVIINKIEFIGSKIKQFGIVLSIVFTLISLLVVFNTVRIGIYVHKDEVGIMKLVGASNWFIRGPFLVESVLYAVFGCLIFWIIFYTLVVFANPIIAGFFGEIGFNLGQYLLSNFIFIFGFELLLMILLNMISSMMAVSRYLKR